MKRELILGPPGCGKTTECIAIMERELAAGVRPEKILYTTFTKRGANEAITRACEKFKFRRSQLPYFRTMHSLAFQEMGLNREDVMQLRDYKKIGLVLGLDFGWVDLEEGQLAPGTNKGDQMLYLLSMARAKCITPEEQYKDTDFDFSWFEFDRFIKTLAEYKSTRGLVDFSDMIDAYLDDGKSLDIEVAIIDEAQDLSKQQWRMAEKSIEKCKRLYIAGDDDQAIFKWSGADVDTFLKLKGAKKVLNHSFRLTKSVHSLAQKISNQITHRFPKTWGPRDEEGSVDYVNTISDMDIREGTNLCLARNKYLLKEFEEVLRREGFPYTNARGSSIDDDQVLAIRIWEKLRAGEVVHVDMIRIPYALLATGTGVKHGFKSLKGAKGDLTIKQLKKDWGLLTDAIWHDALVGLADIPYYLAVLRRKEKLDKPPRVHVSTIHAVKGGEADHVLLMTDISWKTYLSYKESPDDEHRVFYVGATRARKTLQIMLPKSNIYYQMP